MSDLAKLNSLLSLCGQDFAVLEQTARRRGQRVRELADEAAREERVQSVGRLDDLDLQLWESVL